MTNKTESIIAAILAFALILGMFALEQYLTEIDCVDDQELYLEACE